MNVWLESSDSHFLKGIIERELHVALNQEEVQLKERKTRSDTLHVASLLISAGKGSTFCTCTCTRIVDYSDLIWVPVCSRFVCLAHDVSTCHPVPVCLSRLRALLEAEEQQLLQEMEKMESMEEKKARMRERAEILRERRERDRKQLVSDKLEQHFR